MKTVALIFILISNFAYAGGVRCSECPSESTGCMPRPGCHTVSKEAFGLAPHCASYFKLKTCQVQCGAAIDAQNTIINQPCVDSCMKQLCR